MSDLSLNESVQALLMALIGVAVTVITLYVIPWLKANASSARMRQAHAISEWVVKSVEQEFVGAPGTHKRGLAAERLAQYAKRVGIKLDENDIDTLIEGAVKQMNDWSDALEAAPAAAVAAPVVVRLTESAP